jgi:hypothetical protein
LQTANSRKQKAEGRQHTRDSRQQKADSRQEIVDSKGQTADMEKSTADSKQKTSDSLQQVMVLRRYHDRIVHVSPPAVGGYGFIPTKCGEGNIRGKRGLLTYVNSDRCELF